MEIVHQPRPALLYYVAGLFIWLGAFFLGNLAGRIIASLQGWENFDYHRPGAVFYSALQAGLGAYFGILASKKWLGDGKYVRLWLAIFVWLTSGAVVVLSGMALYVGRSDVFGWSTLSLIVGLAVIEVVRRMDDRDFD